MTNGYVRLNRPRIKGDVDEENMEISINVLFDVLLKTNILMSPHVPFLTEHMYQNLRKCVKKEGRFYQDSIHHLFIPNAIEDLKNERINELMATTISIIETARKLRENKNISLKQPIMSLSILSQNEGLLADLAEFLPYIEEEINVSEIKIERNIDNFVKLSCKPNLPVLGPRYKGNKIFGALTKAVNALTSEQIKQAQKDGHIVIEGEKLSATEDLLIEEKFLTDKLEEYQTIGGDKAM